jgi:hypothetical protein
MGRFAAADGPPVPYSEVKPERCAPARGPEFVLPGEDKPEAKPRRCGVDPDMPPASVRPHYERDVRLGFAGLKKGRR